MILSQKNSIGTESKYNMKIIILAAILQPVLLDMEHTSNINQVNLSSFKNYNIKEKRFKEKLVYIVTYASCTMPKALYKTNWNSYAKIKGHTQVLTTNGT